MHVHHGFYEQVILFLSGGTFISFVAHAVNTFPTPRNPYGVWLLGVIQWAVGQRVVAKNTLQGFDTITTAMEKTGK